MSLFLLRSWWFDRQSCFGQVGDSGVEVTEELCFLSVLSVCVLFWLSVGRAPPEVCQDSAPESCQERASRGLSGEHLQRSVGRASPDVYRDGALRGLTGRAPPEACRETASPDVCWEGVCRGLSGWCIPRPVGKAPLDVCQEDASRGLLIRIRPTGQNRKAPSKMCQECASRGLSGGRIQRCVRSGGRLRVSQFVD